MKTIKIIDPVTRIEGHLKVQITIENNKISDAQCTGTLFRGFEQLLLNRVYSDAPILTQRICGVCPVSHGHSSVLALENVSNWRPPGNARILRNLALGANFVQSHILHFYLLSLFDYIKGPDKFPWKPAWEVDLRDGLGHVADHLSDAITARRHAHEMGAVFTGKMPHHQASIAGGFTLKPDADHVSKFKEHLTWLKSFIQNVYIPDAEAIADVYDDYYSIGGGHGNLLSFGAFKEDNAYENTLIKKGYLNQGDVNPTLDFDSTEITESVNYSWYNDSTDNLNPANGETIPQFPKNNAYSWLKSPRLNDKPYELGPLARMKVSGFYNGTVSIMGRHIARAYETLKIAEAMETWINQLNPNEKAFDKNYEQAVGAGIGFTEAPRGGLGHWVEVDNNPTGGDKIISHYQVITPTCWNASPKDSNNMHGPMEKALIGTPIADSTKPIEALRVIHSFDPCLSCAVHLMKPNKKPEVIYSPIS